MKTPMLWQKKYSQIWFVYEWKKSKSFIEKFYFILNQVAEGICSLNKKKNVQRRE